VKIETAVGIPPDRWRGTRWGGDIGRSSASTITQIRASNAGRQPSRAQPPPIRGSEAGSLSAHTQRGILKRRASARRISIQPRMWKVTKSVPVGYDAITWRIRAPAIP